MTDNPSEPTEVNPSGQTVSPAEERILEVFAGMMRSCDGLRPAFGHRIRDTVRTVRERVSGDTTNF